MSKKRNVQTDLSEVEPQLQLEIEEPRHIPVGVALDGQIIGAPRIFDIAQNHFTHKKDKASAAVGHEWFSLHGAGLTIVTSLATAAWTQSSDALLNSNVGAAVAATALSAPILWTLYKGKNTAERDLRKVERLAKHYNAHGDIKIAHALGFQLEGLVDENDEPVIQNLDKESYKKNYCIESNLTKDDLKKAKDRPDTITVSKDDTKLKKALNFPVDVTKEIYHVLSNPKEFGSDIIAGWGGFLKQSGDLINHFKEAAFKNACLAHSTVYVGRSVNDNSSDYEATAEEQSYEHERKRLLRERKALIPTLVGTNYSFIAEHGFFTLEGFNGVNYLIEGIANKDLSKGALGVSHIFCALAALGPTQEVVHENRMAYNNFTSVRAEAAKKGMVLDR